MAEVHAVAIFRVKPGRYNDLFEALRPVKKAFERAGVVSACWWKKQKASSSSEFAKRLALAGRRVKEDDAHGKG
jgi:hypothetical protein